MNVPERFDRVASGDSSAILDRVDVALLGYLNTKSNIPYIIVYNFLIKYSFQLNV